MATFCGDRDRCYEGHNHQDLHKEGLLKRYEGKQVNDIKDSEHRWIEACSGYFCNGWNHKEILNPYLKKMIGLSFFYGITVLLHYTSFKLDFNFA
jgi:hypothetical protein